MWYLYLDESGDLGFDFVNKKPSKFFTITILVIKGNVENRLLFKAVKKTLRRRLNPRGKRKRIVAELKGTKTTLEIKKYFYEQVKSLNFNIYAITLNKRRLYEYLIKNKSRVYNFIARNVLDQISFKEAKIKVELIIDKSKSKPEIVEFNSYIRRQLEAELDPKIPLNIYHFSSIESGGLQAADMFSYGIFEKHERRRMDWLNIFKEKVMYDSVCLP
ncbi:MAG: hypothetical protein A2545_06780 [Planctomycetes bacterium RIFOXYD2_FULL_41_16]|nr:MAG: hypothetical protein A2545_06780 [Planctomycetes bacterium RIFOXYD2_FULL_41_16]